MNALWKDVENFTGDLYTFLGNPVNIADENGLLKTGLRKGDYHAGSFALIQKAKIDSSNCLDFDSNGGIACCFLGDHVVGVLIVDGISEDSKNLLLMAKRMTEMYISERFADSREQMLQITGSELVKEWIFSPVTALDNTFATYMAIAEIDIRGKYIVAVLWFMTPDKERVPDRTIERIHKLCRSQNAAMPQLIDGILVEDKYICLFRSDDTLWVQRVLSNFKESIQRDLSVCVCGGIGQVCEDYTKVNYGYITADKACVMSLKSRQTQISRYDELTIDLLVEEIPAQTKSDFVNKVFAGCKKTEVDEWKVLLKAFFTSNGSISRVADDLFIHKNTLQYKLNKIREQTGYDPRIICDALKLYIAILFSTNQSY